MLRTHRFIKALLSSCALLTTLVALPAPARAAAAAAKPPLKVVQLGDSYSAGNGARNTSGDRDYRGVEGCFRSPSNWGSQYVATLQTSFAVSYTNRACSGGVIADITQPRGFKNAVVGQLVSCPPAAYPEQEFWVRTDGFPFDHCQRFLRPQIEAVDESTDLVLMTAGGNDAKFAKVVEQCFAVGYRDPGDCRRAIEFANGKLQDLEDDLVDAFEELRAKLRSDAHIVLVAYPYLVDDVDYRLRSLSGRDTYDAGDEIRRFGAAGDVRQRDAVRRANGSAGAMVHYVDSVKSLFNTHAPNPDQTAPRNPDRWLYEFETRITEEFYHYNPTGHQKIASLLIPSGSFGASGRPGSGSADVDVAFVVDTTGSMGGTIANVRSGLSSLVNQLAATTNSYRVAVISYRDFAERTGWSGDYPARLDLNFSSSLPSIQAAINSLRAEGGGDIPETVFSGISTAIDLSWRPGVTKTAIVIGDAAPLSPEPISGLTAEELVRRSLAVDPVQVLGVDVGSMSSGGALQIVASGTGGSIVRSTSGVTSTLSSILTTTASKPIAWMGDPYAGKISTPIAFDGSGSYDPSGGGLTKFEWDFEGDGVFDLVTSVPSGIHAYPAAFDGVAVLRVTGPGGTALASARVVVNAEGIAPQGDTEPCDLDDSGRPIIVDEEGRPIPCIPSVWPLPERPDVVAESSESVVVVARPSVTGVASPGGLLGTAVRDVATISGGNGPTGNLIFRLFADRTCTTEVFASTVPLVGSTGTSAWFTPEVGTYYWTATYDGDTRNGSAATPCGSRNQSVVITAFAPPATTRTITGDFVGPLTVEAGESVLVTEARVAGGVRVKPGGSLNVFNSRVTSGILADGPAFFSLCGSDVSGASPATALDVRNATVPIRIGDPESACPGNRFVGQVVLTANSALRFAANTGSNNVDIRDNGPGGTVIMANKVFGTLACAGSNPVPVNPGLPNTAAAKTGQCSLL